MNEQLTGAESADKSLKQLPQTFERLANETNGVSGYLHRRLNPNTFGVVGGAVGGGAGLLLGGPSGAIKGAGIGVGAGETLGHGMQGATDTAANREYDSDRTNLIGMVSSALKGTNIGGEQIERLVRDNSPETGESNEQKMKKFNNILDFIIIHLPRGTLEAHGLTTKRD
jgi:hypothetical protein